jgi:hypothetical protein
MTAVVLSPSNLALPHIAPRKHLNLTGSCRNVESGSQSEASTAVSYAHISCPTLRLAKAFKLTATAMKPPTQLI